MSEKRSRNLLRAIAFMLVVLAIGCIISIAMNNGPVTDDATGETEETTEETATDATGDICDCNPYDIDGNGRINIVDYTYLRLEILRLQDRQEQLRQIILELDGE